MGRKRKGRRQSPADLGSRDFTCPYCGYFFAWAWMDIFDLQESTHGFVGFEAPLGFITCPKRGEPVDEEVEDSPYAAGSPKAKERPVPRPIRADMLRGLMHAYYQYVCGCSVTDVDEPLIYGDPWVALGITPERIWLADFSTTYEFPLEMKPATVVRRMQARSAEAVAQAASYTTLSGGSSLSVEYEVWCFVPPSARLIGAYDQVRAAGGKVILVYPDNITERIRQTVLAVPPDPEEHAFAKAAVMIRTAFGLEPQRSN